MMKYPKVILFIAFFAGISALMAMDILYKQPEGMVSGRQSANTYNNQIVDSAVSLLRSGNIVLRMGTGADSYLLSQMNRKNKDYSHCGIVMMENGYPFVYHSIGGEDNPDERLRRDSANFFFSPAHNTGIAIVRYDYDNAAIARLRGIVAAYYNARPKFDMKFDLKTDDKLYCSEFVCKALNRAMSNDSYIKVTSVLGYKFVGTDDLFINPHAYIFWQKKFK
jgi:hypothetical protein